MLADKQINTWYSPSKTISETGVIPICVVAI